MRVGAHDRAGLGRLLRYCARPPFALERLELLEDERVVYRLDVPEPMLDWDVLNQPEPDFEFDQRLSW